MSEQAVRTKAILPPVRAEFINKTTKSTAAIGDIARPLSLWEKITNITLMRRLFIIAVLAVIWQAYASRLGNALMFPTFTAMTRAFTEAALQGNLLQSAWTSLSVLLKGYAIGVVIAALLTTLAVSTRIGNDLLATLTSMLNPLPAIALLPLALLWFGLGDVSLVFVLVHAVLWPMALNTHSGFLAVSETLRMVGRNSGLRGMSYVTHILVPAAFPAILAGLKISWAFAWRTLIAAELVFGATSASGGIGWFIFENKNDLNIPEVFAGLATVIIIGLIMDSIVFRAIEARTVQRWGMQRS
jgi:NitT/TauT family transport system permease protein